MNESFLFPNLENMIDHRSDQDKKIIIVSIIGKSALNTADLKVRTFKNLFQSEETNSNTKDMITGYFDEKKNIIYLHAYTMLDTQRFAGHCEAPAKDTKNFSKFLFILLHVSHIIVLTHPICDVDLNYIKYFRFVDSLRQTLGSRISELLMGLESLSQEWVTSSRFCLPRLLFYFEYKKCKQNLQHLELEMKDRILEIFQTAGIINTSTSWVTIPVNQQCVYISNTPELDHISYAVTRSLRSVQPGPSKQMQAPGRSETSTPRSFNRFLQIHIDHAKMNTFSDVTPSTSQQHPAGPAHFELPSLNLWARVSKGVFNIVAEEEQEKPLNSAATYSERRCREIYSIALGRYFARLPSGSYGEYVHKRHLKVAVDLFVARAKDFVGFHDYYLKLIGVCNNRWKMNKELCEHKSLTDNPCALPKHSAEEEHFSGVHYVAACNCGKTQATRADPYTPKCANFTFYKRASRYCVSRRLKRIDFPVAKSTSASGNSELQDEAAAYTGPTAKPPPLMLTTLSPPGLLPQFASWSLVCLGSASLYSHEVGLKKSFQPGFISGSNFLLSHQAELPTPKKVDPRRFRFCSVKIFVGFEYECRDGNRFMLVAPNKILKVSGKVVADTAKAVLESDMPLYFPCPCKSEGPLMAQLMRIHIVTPMPPAVVTVNAKVQPMAGSPIFTSQPHSGLSLVPSSYCVMRLPFIYACDNRTYAENQTGRLLKGLFVVNQP